MKKTLFLSAILATALCSSAFATTVEYNPSNISGFNDTYATSGYTISSGNTLQLNHGGAYNDHSLDLEKGCAITPDVTLDGGTLYQNDSTWKLTGTTTVASSSTISTPRGKVLTIAQLNNAVGVTGSSDVVLTLSRGREDGTAYTLTQLTGENTFSGTIKLTTPSSGKHALVLSNAGAATHAAVQLADSDKTLLALNVANATVRSLSGAGSIILAKNDAGNMQGYDGSVTASTLTLTESSTFHGSIGAGVTVSTTAALTVDGATTVNGALNATNVTINTDASLTLAGSATLGSVVVNGTLTGVKDSLRPTSITGSGTVQMNGTLEYHDKDFMEGFTGVVEVVSGATHFGSNGGKFSQASKIKVSGGTFGGWGTTFAKDIELAGGTVRGEGGTGLTLSGAITITSNSRIATNGSVTLTGTVSGQNGATLTRDTANNDTLTISGALSNVNFVGNAESKASTVISSTITAGNTIRNAKLTGQIAGGTVTDCVYYGNNVTGGTLDNVELTFNERLNISGGQVTIGNITHNTTAGYANYALAVRDNGHLTITGTADFTTNNFNKVVITDNSSVTVNAGGALTSGDICGDVLLYQPSEIKGTITVNNGGTLSVKGLMKAKTLTNSGEITVQDTLTATTLSNSGTLTVNGSSLTLSSLTVTADSLIQVKGDHSGTLTTSALTVEGGSTVNANLVVMNGGTMTFHDNAVLSMGCDVTIGDTVTVVLTDDMVQSIMDGNDVEIIAGVDKAHLSQSLTFIGSGTLSDYVAAHESEYSLKQVGDKIYIAPEPATATLSLLALAALAARRRRH